MEAYPRKAPVGRAVERSGTKVLYGDRTRDLLAMLLKRTRAFAGASLCEWHPPTVVGIVSTACMTCGTICTALCEAASSLYRTYDEAK